MFLFAQELVSPTSIGSMHTIYVAACYYVEGRAVKPTPKAVFSHRNVRRVGNSSKALSRLSESGDEDDSAKSNSDATNPSIHRTASSPKLEKRHSSFSEDGETFPLWKV